MFTLYIKRTYPFNAKHKHKRKNSYPKKEWVSSIKIIRKKMKLEENDRRMRQPK